MTKKEGKMEEKIICINYTKEKDKKIEKEYKKIMKELGIEIIGES